MSDLLQVSSSPHVRDRVKTDYIMRMVLLALLPAAAWGIYLFGPRALMIICISVASCVITEWVFELGMKKKVTIYDGSAAVTGLLLAMNLPASAPWWLPLIGGVFAILIVKQLFGGLGQNFMNPALAARCFLLIAFTGRMTDFAVPESAWGRVAGDGIRRHTASGYADGRGSGCESAVFGKCDRNHWGDLCTPITGRSDFPSDF